MNSMSKAYTKPNDEVAPNSFIKPDPSADLEDELRPGYNASTLKNGARGKYLSQYQNSTQQVQQNHKPTKARLNFVEALSLITFVVGLWYLWTSNAIPLYAKTSILTIVGGVFVFAMGQIIQKGYIEPVQELQKVNW